MYDAAAAISDVSAELAAPQIHALALTGDDVTTPSALDMLDSHQQSLGQAFASMRTPQVEHRSDPDMSAAAAADAEAARKTGGDELLKLMSGSVYSHRTDPIYAAPFADTLGPQGKIDLAYNTQTAWDLWQQYPPPIDPNDPDKPYSTIWDEKYAQYASGVSGLSDTPGTAAGQYSTDPVADVAYAHDATPGQITKMTLQNDHLAGFIVGAATVGRDKEDADRDAGINFFFSALSDVLKFVPTLPSKTAGTALSIAQSRPLSSSNETMTSGSPGSTVAGTGQAWKLYNHASAINVMAQAEMIPPEAYTNANGEPYSYEWLNLDGTINLEMFTSNADGSNITDIIDRAGDLNDFAMDDPDFNEWRHHRVDLDDANENEVDYGRGEK